MKAATHPEVSEAKITCACGNVIETRSTRGDYRIDICNVCHQNTGKQKRSIPKVVLSASSVSTPANRRFSRVGTMRHRSCSTSLIE
ncbi:MAG: 50S ribosomal protein L31 [Myxococcota bacterium]